ncbi:MAG: quinolinate synthase NadA [Chloroflexi bacterium]|nr:quinolinate synthase NadA [Chloroflexota bacterium]
MTITFNRPVVIPITELEQSAFCQTDGNLRTKSLEEEFAAGVRWQKVPIRYLKLSPQEIDEGIAAARQALGKQVVVLGHHYQRPDVIKYADFRGDSYKLSQMASRERDSKFIVFCGVHFMAETADILTASDQTVILPNMAAGCSMSDMAQTEDVEDAWEQLSSVLGGEDEIVPVTYMNSTAEIKALCGRNGGIVCTSSNGTQLMEWAFRRGKRILFVPDQHLGRNTALKLGVPLDEMAVWSPFKQLGGHSPDRLRRAKIILWEGHCSVHTRFSVKQIEDARQKYPDVNILVHPECTMEVVQEADYVGSTEYIARMVREAPAGSKWAIGTEINLVKRLAEENADKSVFCLDPIVCPCATMYRVHPAYLLWVLEGIMAGLVINRITVGQKVAEQARIALRRMLEVAG